MFHYLTLEVRNLMIEELRRYWSDHPRYPELANNIQGKYSFDQRPQFGMVVKTGGANNFVMSSDNFLNTVRGYVYLAKTKKLQYGSIEWVKENPKFRAEEGIYILDIIKLEDLYETYQVDITKYKRVKETEPMFISPTEIQLLGTPIENSLRIIEKPSYMRYVEGVDYTLNGDKIELASELLNGLNLEITYTELQVGVIEPKYVRPDQVYHQIIPGVLIYFGRRLRGGDQQAIVVLDTPDDIYSEYGGRWDVSVEIEIIARDVHSQADLADRTTVWMWAVLRDQLASRGINMNEVSLGGESEEVYDENGDDYFYTASISTTLQVDWFMHIPLIAPLMSYGKSLNLEKELPDAENQVGYTGLVKYKIQDLK
jgi:hypothetical protein